MHLSTDDESSDSSSSSGNECSGSSRNLDLGRTFFKVPTPTKPSATGFDDNDSGDSADDSTFEDNDNIDSTALLAEVMKNLENAKKSESTEKVSPSIVSQKLSSKAQQKNVLSNEITDLLLQGEPVLSTKSWEDGEDKDAEQTEHAKPVTEYTIPKEGVRITLPDTCIPTFPRRKKRGTDLQEVLRQKMNRQLRFKQVLIHKVGLMCWLAYGFHLNRAINDCQVLATSLSLVPPGSYPKDRVDLKYLEQFTKWFRNFIKLEFKDISEAVSQDVLLARLREKKICNYREMVLLYAAMLRCLGLNCRLVISLCPPALKLQKEQLFGGANAEPKCDTVCAASTSKQKSVSQERKIKMGVKGSSGKIVPENSGQLESESKLKARKRAAEVLARFVSPREKKPIKPILVKKGEQKPVSANFPEKKDDFKSPPTTRQLRSRLVLPSSASSTINRATKKRNSSQDKGEDNEIPEKRTITTRAGKAAVAPKRIKGESASDKEFDVPAAKKKKIEKNVKTIDEKTSDSDDDFAPKSTTKEIIKISKRCKADVANKNETRKHSPKAPLCMKQEINGREKIDDLSASESDTEQDRQANVRVRQMKSVMKKKASGSKTKREDPIDRRVLSSDDESGEVVDAKSAQNIWVEVFLDAEESWISVCLPDSKIHCVNELYKKAPKPVLYVVAWNSAGNVKDVTRRYCPHWLTVTRKQRIDEKWWQQSLDPWMENSTPISRAEDEMLLQRELEQPLPKSVGECKGHPLYALTRHLLKFEALYPPDSVPLGYLKTGEAVYSRHCVHALCSRETWMRKARVVKPAQEPYKIVKAMPKYDKLSGTVKRDLPLELFGKWQTTQYVPPAAKDGIVPRNEYGSVDLFQESMLPFGTVHINLPALNRVARKLNIDCAPAVVGFNFGSRGAMPLTEGYVVCTEFEEILREAWHADQIEATKRAVEKREKRVYGNWKKLIKGLFIRERLAVRYDFYGENEDENDEEQPSTSIKSQSNHKASQVCKSKCKNSKN